MQSHGAPDAGSGGHALRTQRAGSAHHAVEPEAFQFVGAAGEIGSCRHGRQLAGNLSGRTGAGARRQVGPRASLAACCPGHLAQHRHCGPSTSPLRGYRTLHTAKSIGTKPSPSLSLASHPLSDRHGYIPSVNSGLPLVWFRCGWHSRVSNPTLKANPSIRRFHSNRSLIVPLFGNVHRAPPRNFRYGCACRQIVTGIFSWPSGFPMSRQCPDTFAALPHRWKKPQRKGRSGRATPEWPEPGPSSTPTG